MTMMGVTEAADAAGPPATFHPEPSRANKVVLIILSQSMQALAFGGIALFLPLIQIELDLSFTQAGTIAAAATGVYAVMQMPSGILADRLGARRLYLLGLLGSNLLAFNFAQMHDYRLLLINQVGSGFFRSLVFAPGILLMTSLFSAERRATAIGLMTAGGFSSNIFLNTLGPILVGSVGWRGLFEGFSIVGLGTVVLQWRLGTRGLRGSADRQLSVGAVLELFRYRVMWVIGGIQFVRLALAQGMFFWLPSLIVFEKHQSLAVAGLVVAMGTAMTAPSNFLGGYVSDRLRNPLLVIAVSQAILAVTTFVLVYVTTLPLLLLVVFLNGVFCQAYFGSLFSYPITMLGQSRAGLSSGFSNFFANVGSFSVVLLLGVVRDSSGSFDLGLHLLTLIALIGFGLTILLARMRPKGPDPTGD